MISIKTYFGFSMTVICALVSSAAYSQTCTTSDTRNSVEQLDCFCNPKDTSRVQQRVAALGDFARTFGIDGPLTCSSAVFQVLALTDDPNADKNVSNELTSLGYTSDQSSPLLDRARLKVQAMKSRSNTTSSRSYTLSIGPFTWSNKAKSAPAADMSQLTQDELVEVMTVNSQRMIALMLKRPPELFTNYFHKLDRVEQISANYPRSRTSACLKVTSNLDEIGQCLDSPASDDKITSCVRLNMIASETLQCLGTKADPEQLRACGSLNMIGSEALQCLNLTATPATIYGCGRLNMIGSETLRCIQIGASDDRIAACGRLNMIGSETLQCLNTRQDIDMNVIDACGRLGLIGSETLACIQSGASPEKIQQCGGKGLVGSGTLECLTQN